MTVSGLLPIYKPSGISSKDVSRRLTRVLGKIKMGHVGTLDPIAEGVLPILLGKATRLQDYLLSSKKTYQCDIKLGEGTDTLDREGTVVESTPFDHVTESMVLEKLELLGGVQTQVPPLYSAVKFQGKALYKYAREGRGDEVPLESLKRQIEVYRIDFLGFHEGVLRFEAEVSKGTYIRVLGYDLAKKLGTCGHMTKLVRTVSSEVSLSETLQLEPLMEALEKGESLDRFLLSLGQIPLQLPKVEIFSSSHVQRLIQGQTVILSPHDDFLASESILSSILNSSGDALEVLLENKDYSLFAIADMKRSPKGVSCKVRKGFL